MLKNTVRIVLLLLIAGTAWGVIQWWRRISIAGVETCTVDVGDLLTGTTVSGIVRSRQKTAVAAETVAVVKRLAVTEGQHVSEGNVLVELDGGVIEADCAKARSRVDFAGQYLAELKAGPRAEQITQARETLKHAKAKLHYIKADHEKIASLLKRGTATRSEFDLAVKQLRMAEAETARAQAQLDLLLAGARREQIARAEAEVSLAEAEVRRCNALRQKYTLRAPHAGIVTAKYVNIGEVVSIGQVLLRLDNIEDIEIRAGAQEAQLPDIKPGSRARVLADAYPDCPLEAVVENILPRVDPESGTVTVLLRLTETPTVVLMDGMAVDVALIGRECHGVIRVPAGAVEKRDGLTVVQVREGRSFVRRHVNVGISDGRWVEVKSGLKVGDVVRTRK
ncbi:MAG: efflux RND transporter periplasmic adaptor subunit [Planctomycetota bacterium]|nr:efflux RND transporter periplasmic adaptor subunit [Planctomycetota bacterium]